jgi:hypothetical protein
MLQPGEVFAGYRIERLLDRGGMGVVYMATEVDLERTVALKLIAPEHARDETAVARFKSEARLAAGLEHPNIVPIFRGGEHNGVLFLAMRFVDGTNLRRIIDRGPMPLPRISRIITEIAEALDVAHARGLVHRDVKPANILISGEGANEHVYLTDFGLTKRLGSAGDLTRTGGWVGTPDYVAPEQIQGHRVDRRADVYSLGCVLFEMLTGHVAYPKDSDMAKLWAHVTDPPPLPRTERPDLVVDFDAIVAKATAKDPDDRFATAGALAAAVREAVVHQNAKKHADATQETSGGDGAPFAPTLAERPIGERDEPAERPDRAKPAVAAAGAAGAVAAAGAAGAAAAPAGPAAADAPPASDPPAPGSAPASATAPTPSPPAAPPPAAPPVAAAAFDGGGGDGGRWGRRRALPLIAGAVLAVGAVVAGVVLLSGGSDNSSKTTAAPPKAPPGDQVNANLGPVPTNHVTGDGKVVMRLDNNDATVSLTTTGLLNATHPLHIHAGKKGVCPPASAAKDHNGHFAISTLDGVPWYGPPVTALTTRGKTTPQSILALRRFPSTGDITYKRTFQLSKAVAAFVRAGDAVIVVHGADYNHNGIYDNVLDRSDLNRALPGELTTPALCGPLVLKKSSAGSGSGSTASSGQVLVASLHAPARAPQNSFLCPLHDLTEAAIDRSVA